MLLIKFFVLALFSFATASIHFPQANTAHCVPNRGWCPATYNGLITGQSTRSDVLRVLGEPLSSGASADQDEPRNIIWHDYKSIEKDIPGRLGVEVDKRTDKIVAITITPDEMTKDEAIARFGSDYTIMGYESCQESEDESQLTAGIAIVYESPTSSQFSYIEYRKKGLSIHLRDKNYVSEIYFTDTPIGLSSEAECKNELDKLKAENEK